MKDDDQALTRERIALRDLYTTREIVPARGSFGCPLLSRCALPHVPLITGTWAYVGTQYGQAQVAGKAAKILFVAMDRGGYEGADIESLAAAQSEFRRGAEAPTNPHMGGVHLLMRELVDEADPAVFALQFALTNAVKCARTTHRMGTRPSPAMIGNCAGHLATEIAMLEPDLTITQGQHPAATCKSILGEVEAIATLKSNGRRLSELCRSGKMLLLTTPHPARLKGLKWRRGVLPDFLLDAVARVRQELGLRHG